MVGGADPAVLPVAAGDWWMPGEAPSVGRMGVAVAYVEVETQPDGSLLVQWELEGEPAPVDVAVGTTPEHLDHRHQRTVDAGERRIVLPVADRGRHFVSVAPHGGGPAVVAADRRVPFEGVSNFRDLGGY